MYLRTKNHKWFELQGTLGTGKCCGQGHLPQEQFAQDHFQHGRDLFNKNRIRRSTEYSNLRESAEYSSLELRQTEV